VFFSSKISAYSAYSRGTEVGILEGEIVLTWASDGLVVRPASAAALSSVTSMRVNRMSPSHFGSTLIIGRIAGRHRFPLGGASRGIGGGDVVDIM
jgi:hypothetical protein